MPDFILENQFSLNLLIAGVDEVGCGPWAGPLVAAACIIDQINVSKDLLNHIDDSKKITKNKRLFIMDCLEKEKNKTIWFSIGCIDIKDFNELTLKKALPLAMKKALDGLHLKPHHVLIDGIRKPDINYDITMITKGDQKSYSIAAASIIAKVYRDNLMDDLHEKYPMYGWNTNAGYGTKTHRDAIEKFGITKHHRTCYAPIKKIMNLK